MNPETVKGTLLDDPLPADLIAGEQTIGQHLPNPPRTHT
jgi:hypothetical protein